MGRPALRSNPSLEIKPKHWPGVTRMDAAHSPKRPGAPVALIPAAFFL